MKTHLVIISGTALECRFSEDWVGEGICRVSATVSDAMVSGCAGSAWVKTIQLWFQTGMLALLLVPELALKSLHHAPHQQ